MFSPSKKLKQKDSLVEEKELDSDNVNRTLHGGQGFKRK